MNFGNIQKCILSGFDNETCRGDRAGIISTTNITNSTTFKHTEEEKNALIRTYLQEEKHIKLPEDCAIGVGYNMCTDINFRAVDVINMLEEKIVQMEEEEGEIKAYVHPKISTLREFIETFAY